jgi:hypothetical protein
MDNHDCYVCVATGVGNERIHNNNNKNTVGGEDTQQQQQQK